MPNEVLTKAVFQRVAPNLYAYFSQNYTFPKGFVYDHFHAFFKITILPFSEDHFAKISEYIDLLYSRNVHQYYIEYEIYQVLFETLFLPNVYPHISTNMISIIYDAIIKKCDCEKKVSPLRFYKIMDAHPLVCRNLLLEKKICLQYGDLMNMLEVIEGDYLDMILSILQNSHNTISQLIEKGDVPFDLLDILTRDFAKSPVYQKALSYLFTTYPAFIQYDDSLDTLCQMKSVNVSFLHDVFDKIKEEKYAKLPAFVDDENGINLLIHKEDESLTLKYLHLIEIQNYSNYINHAIEKKMFTLIDYLCKAIYQLDSTYFQSTHFCEKIRYTTLFYDKDDYDRLNTIFVKYGIAEKKCDFEMAKPDSEHRCQICLEDAPQLKCPHCHQVFHIQCMVEYMKSQQKEKVEAEAEAQEIQLEIEVNEYPTEEEASEVEEEEASEAGASEAEEESEASASEESETGEAAEYGYVGTYPIVNKDDLMCIYSKWFKEIKCVHCRQPWDFREAASQSK